MTQSSRIDLVVIAVVMTTLAIIAVFGTSGCSTRPLVKHATQSEEAERYAVYSAALKEIFKEGHGNVLAIQNETSTYEDSRAIYGTDQRVAVMKDSYPAVSLQTLADFEKKNAKPVRLDAQFNIGRKYELADKFSSNSSPSNATKEESDRELEELLAFLGKYQATGMVRLSEIGFNSERTEAFLYVEFIHCLVLCGHGDHVLLVKEAGVWKVKEIFEGWRS